MHGRSIVSRAKHGWDKIRGEDVSTKLSVASAPTWTWTSAAGRGLQAIIAGAGGAAHLPGMVAAMTPLPVIGVPIKTSTLNGQDSLLSIVQMPRGVPVATVAIGNATNAGLLAVRCLCASRPELREKMEEYQLNMKRMVDRTSEALLEQGSDKFLEGMGNKSKSVNV